MTRPLAIAVTLLLGVLPACSAEVRPASLQFTAMTRNLYLGTGLQNLVGVSSQDQLVAAVSQDWGNVLATDLPARAGALAEEIAAVRPDVIGLQEVTLWRDQTPSDIVSATPVVAPNATHVVFDFLAILRAELASRDVPYTAVSTSTNADVEAPRAGGGPTSFVDVRITDRDVILVRADLASRFGNRQHGNYAATMEQPSFYGDLVSTRGWASIDYRVDQTTTVRILDTHLEVQAPDPAIQERQAAELLALVEASPHPVVVLGDVNASPTDDGSRTYGRLTAALRDAWATARPTDVGLTCCQEELLTNREDQTSRRIDLILTSADWPVDHATVVGAEPFQDAPPRWASDHAGVTVRLTIHP